MNFFKVGPPTTPWTSADIDDAKLWDQAVWSRGAYTWINLSTLSRAQPGSSTHSLLNQVITTLKGDSLGSDGIGMWKGADEPWWNGFPVSSLQFAYCLATSRGEPGWCANYSSLDSDHLWVTIQAPRGTASDLAPYSAVTDVHGSDAYPIDIDITNPDLHQVGRWTSTIASITPSQSVWTTLQICSSGSYNANGYVLPTRLQERYMIYDAIINGARSLNFYGGNNPNCWNASDAAYGWNWTFWNTVLKSLVQEISASSEIAPALVNTASEQALSTSDSTTQGVKRLGATSNDIWVIAARSGSGTQTVTISGLPATITSGAVYTEGRSVTVSNGSFTDNFAQWGVHVYRFTGGAPTAVTVARFGAKSAHGSIVVSWRTGHETNLLGFNVYRVRGGRMAKVNPNPIAARTGAAASGARYRIVDHLSRGSSMYRLELLRLDGSRTWAAHTQVQAQQ